MFERIVNFDVVILTWVGWLLMLVVSTFYIGTAFAMVFYIQSVADTVLANDLTKWIAGITQIFVGAGLFVGLRWIAERLGLTGYRDGANESINDNEEVN